MDRNSFLIAGKLFILFCLPAVLLAGPPFVTDDPEPVELHHWEAYVASQIEHDPDGTSATLPHLEVNYGAVPNLQLHVILPMAYGHPSIGPSHYGFGDTELGLKYRILEQSPGRPMVGLFPLLELPSGNSDRGLGSGHARMLVPLWLQKDWSRWTTYGGGGYFFDMRDKNQNYWLLGWEIQCYVSGQLMVGAELFALHPITEGNRDQLNFNIGGQFDINSENHILFSMGRSIKGTVNLSSYIAYQWTFGPAEKSRESK